MSALNPYASTNAELTGERAFAAVMVEVALRDLLGDKPMAKQDAHRWLFTGWHRTFVLCAAILGFNPEAFRQHIYKAWKNGSIAATYGRKVYTRRKAL